MRIGLGGRDSARLSGSACVLLQEAQREHQSVAADVTEPKAIVTMDSNAIGEFCLRRDPHFGRRAGACSLAGGSSRASSPAHVQFFTASNAPFLSTDVTSYLRPSSCRVTSVRFAISFNTIVGMFRKRPRITGPTDNSSSTSPFQPSAENTCFWHTRHGTHLKAGVGAQGLAHPMEDLAASVGLVTFDSCLSLTFVHWRTIGSIVYIL